MANIPAHLLNETLNMESLASDAVLTEARDLCSSLVDVDREIVALEATLSEKKAEKLRLSMRAIPDILTQIGVDNIGLPNQNVDVVVKPYYKAGISAEWEEDRREAAFQWLEYNNHGDVVVTNLIIPFKKGELELSQKIYEIVKTVLAQFDENNERNITITKSVHWQTLTSLVKELSMIREEAIKAEVTPTPPPLPLEMLGATVGKLATIRVRK